MEKFPIFLRISLRREDSGLKEALELSRRSHREKGLPLLEGGLFLAEGESSGKGTGISLRQCEPTRNALALHLLRAPRLLSHSDAKLSGL